MSRKEKCLLAALLLAALWVLFYNLGLPNMYHLRNESRRAQISREMIETGDWLIPQLEEETILTKPPLFYWSVAALSLETGVTQLTARIPSAAAGFGLVMFTFLIGRLLFGTRTGFLAAFALLATSFFMHQSRYAELEGMLSFFIIATIFFFLKGYRDPPRQGRWFALSFAMMGLGVMTKGPFAVTFPLIPIAGMLVYSREAGLLRKKAFLRGLIPFFCIVLPWPLFIMKGNPDFIKLVLWETVCRAATGFVHREPVHYYVMELIKVLYPWIFYLPFAVWLACSRRLRSRRKELVFVLLWFLGNLVFLSLLRSKRDYYLFPVAPAVALLVAATWDAFWQWVREKVTADRDACLRYAFLGGGLLAGLAFVGGNPFAVNIPSMHSLNIPCILLFVGTGAMAAGLTKKLRPRAALGTVVFTATVVLMLAVHFLFFSYTAPILNVEESGKQFYLTVDRIVPQDAPLAFAWKNENYTFTFYAHRQVRTLKEEDEIAPYMASPGRVYLVMRRSRYEKLGPLPWPVIYESPFTEHGSWKGYLLLRNR